jgi:hypothetical protein
MTSGDAGGPPGRPDPDERRCDECGHVWFTGERHHQYFDLGADRDHELEVLCALCLHKRRLTTGVDTSSPATGDGPFRSGRLNG